MKHAGRNQKPASESIWYVLATVAGEPAADYDGHRVIALNRYYWNGLMQGRVAIYRGMVENSLGHGIEFPKLSVDDQRKVRQALDARGFNGIDIPRVNDPIDFSDTEFSEFTSFAGFVFGGETRFENARFSGDSFLFSEVIFAGNVTFDNAEFCQDTMFTNAEFGGVAGLNKTRFFKKVFFSAARFSSPTDFRDAEFLGDVQFNSTKFAGETRFENTAFARRANFQSAEFTRATHFQRVKFETSVPSFFEATLYGYTDWYDSKWPDVPKDPDHAREQVQGYQRLGLLMSQLEKPNDQHFFFRKEMRAQRRAEGWSIAHVMNWLYEVFCDYGHGLGRIVSFWLGHMIVGAIAIWISRVLNADDGGSLWRAGYRMLPELPSALVISFSNAHALLGLNRNFLLDIFTTWKDVPLFNIIGGVQTVVGVILLFFLLLTVRNRFRMR